VIKLSLAAACVSDEDALERETRTDERHERLSTAIGCNNAAAQLHWGPFIK